MQAESRTDDTIRVYWQPGCTSCLQTKEYLAMHGVPFVSRNVLADPEAFAELSRFKLRQVPIVTRGDGWANGQVPADVAALVGIRPDTVPMLPVREMKRRVDKVLDGAQRFFAQVPDAQLDTLLPNRPRSYSELAYHIFNIVDAFLEEKAGQPLVYESYYRLPPPGQGGREQILAYGAGVHGRLQAWFAGPGRQFEWGHSADVYYGRQSQHQFFERTTWHSMQHTRQMMWVLQDLHGIAPKEPLTADLFEGLPMPEQVWEEDLVS
jgi:glutaredoxin